ncbi:hypothetical protein BO94DRAFT_123138 [Aspergillus sclerotioniger CBS 115572]|uniref:Uncharacterized protein n=1 Tax=Aspergillus sclerotioniger CBS 115572 TaxID=1450535 RepID=A0A317WDF7_9EURO|nr:hypothetical protein BO94DRAFT_123138 [Aspergillus sclerotioniger CBS 115572]PWY83252.1 hypothetical protein BO94DRAFT_123138 [Aspergillus sclerotioniger CBS 115572]
MLLQQGVLPLLGEEPDQMATSPMCGHAHDDADSSVAHVRLQNHFGLEFPGRRVTSYQSSGNPILCHSMMGTRVLQSTEGPPPLDQVQPRYTISRGQGSLSTDCRLSQRATQMFRGVSFSSHIFSWPLLRNNIASYGFDSINSITITSPTHQH